MWHGLLVSEGDSAQPGVHQGRLIRDARAEEGRQDRIQGLLRARHPQGLSHLQV